MSTLQEAQRVVASLSRSDRAQLLPDVILDWDGRFPGIEKMPGVMGGDPCIRRTRIPVWLLVSFQRQGMSETELLENYPGLNSDDLKNAWAYARLYPEDIDRQIREQEEA